MTAEEARTHIRYSTWASRRLLDAALALDPEQFHRDVGVGYKNISGTLQHIERGDRIWLRRLTGMELPPAGAVEQDLPEVRELWEKYAGGLADSDLGKVISYIDLRGDAHHTRVDHIILHVVNHATLHRGQVMAMMRQLGVAPPPTDLIFYYREQK